MITIAAKQIHPTPIPGVPLTMPGYQESDARTPRGTLLDSNNRSRPSISPLPSLTGLGSLRGAEASGENPVLAYFNPPNPASKAIRWGGAAVLAAALGLFALEKMNRRKR
jgi:hypothetical protein